MQHGVHGRFGRLPISFLCDTLKSFRGGPPSALSGRGLSRDHRRSQTSGARQFYTFILDINYMLLLTTDITYRVIHRSFLFFRPFFFFFFVSSQFRIWGGFSHRNTETHARHSPGYSRVRRRSTGRVGFLLAHVCFQLSYSDYYKASLLYSPALRRAPYLHVSLHLVLKKRQTPTQGGRCQHSFPLFVTPLGWKASGPEWT